MKIRKIKSGIFVLDSEINGPSVSIFSGVHGNELAGIEAVKKAIEKVKIKKGKVYFVFANKEAILRNTRYVQKNLNRCFLKENKIKKLKTYEEKRALELMEILDDSEALLDLHSSNNSKTEPFIITEENAFWITKNLPFSKIVTGIDRFEPGSSDGYMYTNNKIGICLECGSASETDNLEKNIDLAYNSILIFLNSFGILEKTEKSFENIDKINQKVLILKGVQKVTSNNFEMNREFYDFEKLDKKQLISKDEYEHFYLEKNSVLLFATQKKQKIGDEAYLWGNWKQ